MVIASLMLTLAGSDTLGLNGPPKFKLDNSFLGLLASSNAANPTAFVPSQTLIDQVLPIARTSGKYGGVMLWDRNNDKQSGYGSQIKNHV